jgi:hypothetical protein
LSFTVEDPSRVSLPVSSLVWQAAQWSQTRTLTVDALDDGVHDATDSVVVHFVATSVSEYYDNYAGSFTVTLTDVDPAPTTTTRSTSTTTTTTVTTTIPTSTTTIVAPAVHELPRTGTDVGVLFDVGTLAAATGASMLAAGRKRALWREGRC